MRFMFGVCQYDDFHGDDVYVSVLLQPHHFKMKLKKARKRGKYFLLKYYFIVNLCRPLLCVTV